MSQFKLTRLQIKLVCVISLTLLSFAPVQAKPDKSVSGVQNQNFSSSNKFNKVKNSLVFNAPPPPDDIDAPSDRTAGGTRGCKNTNQQIAGTELKRLTALAPVYSSKDSELVLGLTTASHPTFWFYIPDLPEVSAEFVLQNSAGQIVYQTPISLSGTPGVVSLSLPSTVSPLEIDRLYHWYFNIYCQPQQPPIFVEGWIRRDSVPLMLKSNLDKALPEKRVALFAAHGIWYDALTTAAAVRRTDQKSNDWAALLQAIDLADIAQEPIVKCCQPVN